MSDKVPLRRLFRPGRGAKPPYMAGRGKEMSSLESLLDFVQHGEAPPGDAVLVGPRGNGKTVLIEEFARQCRKAGADVVRRTPDKLRTEEDLAIWLLEPDPKRRKTRRQTTEKETDAN